MVLIRLHIKTRKFVEPSDRLKKLIFVMYIQMQYKEKLGNINHQWKMCKTYIRNVGYED